MQLKMTCSFSMTMIKDGFKLRSSKVWRQDNAAAHAIRYSKLQSVFICFDRHDRQNKKYGRDMHYLLKMISP